ncbi:UPF0488 protein C8orf33 homolog [Exaiptasia diaphana]|uniref:Uncharacterized protein n=1 Tax=Exaiptasia diaphana TaxID=2652724 RepID=A0A913Y5Q1_EXADI|nr:UPF0488 protein C8orf33 homolog [Exaiptasia diaphana]KXJ22551.1 UPF0488 protein C8orf33-like [Exaiptasia diaphana]
MADEGDQKDVQEESSNKGELTAKQKKNKKKKEAAKRKKQEQRENEASDPMDNATNQEPMSPQDKLESELAWCINQLEIGLKVQKPDKTTSSHTEQLIKNLKSPKVPLPKKRQIMRSVFGDYRKKIQDDLKKGHSLVPEKSAKVYPVKKHQQKSVFLRVAQDTKQTNHESVDGMKQSNGNNEPSEALIGQEWKFEPSGGDFKFNFESKEM